VRVRGQEHFELVPFKNNTADISEDLRKQCDLHGACGSSEQNSVSDFFLSILIGYEKDMFREYWLFVDKHYNQC
jgi:hypothetical protein